MGKEGERYHSHHYSHAMWKILGTGKRFYGGRVQYVQYQGTSSIRIAVRYEKTQIPWLPPALSLESRPLSPVKLGVPYVTCPRDWIACRWSRATRLGRQIGCSLSPCRLFYLSPAPSHRGRSGTPTSGSIDIGAGEWPWASPAKVEIMALLHWKLFVGALP